MADSYVARSELTKEPTSMMRQYLEVRAQYEGYILFYRLGDFYECFFEDAVTVSREEELALTGRDCGLDKRAAMCGVPFHRVDEYIGRLVAKGYKVAICEQTEDPKKATGLVKREVVRVVTPGTVTDAGLLTENKNNYLAALAVGEGGYGLGFADISTGEISVTHIAGEGAVSRIERELSVYRPAELILNVARSECAEIAAFANERFHTLINDEVKGLFSYTDALRELPAVFGEEAKKLTTPETMMARGALLAYVRQTQKTDIAFVRDLNVYGEGQYLDMDVNTRRNLELTETMRNKEKAGSLLGVLDRTKTAMGGRLLYTWVTKPLLDPGQITHRQGAVGELLKNRDLREELTEALTSFLDIERLTAKAVYGTANAKDLRAIYTSIVRLPAIRTLLSGVKSETLSRLCDSLDPLTDIADVLGRAIVENPPYTVREGGMIADGYNADIDYYRDIRSHGREIMESIAEREREETGIRTLKVDYNKVFGYYIEISKSLADKVPDRYIRKQTLVNCERYITQELKEMETTIFSADEKLCELEFSVFGELRAMITENSERIRASGAAIAELDVFRSLAEVASKNNYVCPEVDISTDLVIKDGRHPVVEKFVKDTYFVPNDTTLDTGANRVMIITGPNMAGKSTYMRQVALITVMTQIGSFVPAREARVGIVDKVFTRVGASDDLASGQSTFMLEMTEVAAILKHATRRSLIIYDEVGRGTSTYDGMAIARAVVEYTWSKKIGAKTLFATHYHELVGMEESFPGIVNYNVAAKKRGDSVTFLRKIVRGGTDDSYGIEVAKLAGVPAEVIRRAREILAEIESENPAPKQSAKSADEPLDLFTVMANDKNAEVADALRAADLNTMTPIEAMNLLYTLKQTLSSGE